MKNIGIVTRIHGINYGANLQALALQAAIESLGHQCTYINYVVPVHIKGLRRILSFGYRIVRQFLGFKKRQKRTALFFNRLNVSPLIKNKEELPRELERYDILMSGSDQIWNPRYYGTSSGLYLFEGISEKTKVSYASSFGVTAIDENYKKIIRNGLSDYESISCREESGIKILSDLGLHASRHIDPTFLLNSEQWLQIFDKEPIIKGRYICCYVMSGANKLNDFIIDCAEQLLDHNGLYDKIVVLGEKEYRGLFRKHIYITTAGPAEFLNIMYHSSRVLTSSFHGTCFSIIFEKQFNSILEHTNRFNSRIFDLLSLFGLESNIIFSNDNISELNNYPLIDYSPVRKKIADEQNSAYSYLNRALR